MLRTTSSPTNSTLTAISSNCPILAFSAVCGVRLTAERTFTRRTSVVPTFVVILKVCTPLFKVSKSADFRVSVPSDTI